MKTRFNTLDIVSSVTELQRLVGLRLQQVYDIDHKIYLFKLQQNTEKAVLLMESGNRLHTTAFEWPKNMAPSSFSMKLRKHLKNKRLESLKQLGVDRAVDMQFGQGQAAYHVILELYDRGNIILTDCNYIILNVLRPHTEGEQTRFAVKEKYPLDRARQRQLINEKSLREILNTAKTGDTLKKVLVPNLDYGPPLIEHVLLVANIKPNTKLSAGLYPETDFFMLLNALKLADEILDNAFKEKSKGYIIQKREKKIKEGEELLTYEEFHPFLFKQHENKPYKETESFDSTVDEFFSCLIGQKIELKILQKEREAVKKLENVRKDHDQRLKALTETQESDKHRADLITCNQELVDRAISVVRSALANQLSWPDVAKMVEEAKSLGDPVAKSINSLKLEVNNITMCLSDPYSEDEGMTSLLIDIDLDLNAHANARKYYGMKKTAAKKQQKTIESQQKALKSAERKTQQTLKEVETTSNIQKMRKVYWFEKFFWFISSENYLVIGGRDQQQNEIIVRRYLKTGDIYVHADLQGASSVVIKNPDGGPVPPKTLNEAGVMATCYSVAWEAKVIAGAWWVNSNQVSKTAPTGEYLTTGSFMVRGKRNYLPPCQLAMGFGFLFRLEESSIERHLGERKVRSQEEDELSMLVDEDIDKEISPIDTFDSDLQKSLPKTASEENSNNSSDSSDEDDSKDNVKFPDTEVTTVLTLSGASNNDEFVIGRTIPKKNIGFKTDPELLSEKEEQECDVNKPTVKRGQKGKLKKLKEKYKDQDEEERQLRMQILQSAGNSKKNKKPENESSTKRNTKQQNQGKKCGPYRETNIVKISTEIEEQEGGDSDTETGPNLSDMDVLNSITGLPLPEDELLFAVPVVAPYHTYKVKLTPGTGKRGKTAKTALSMFVKDRSCTQRERDLLKSVKEQDLARNFPGKVKLSAPQLTKFRK